MTYCIFLESLGQKQCNRNTVLFSSIFGCLFNKVCFFNMVKNKNLILLSHIIYFWNHQDKTYEMEVLYLNILQFQLCLFVCLIGPKIKILLLPIIYFWSHLDITYAMVVLCLNILQFQICLFA